MTVDTIVRGANKCTMSESFYRWVAVRRKGPWRRDRHAVERAAVNHGLGWWADTPHADGTPRLIYGPLLVIEERSSE